MRTSAPELYIGCPVWACTAWRGSLFTREASREDYLPQYSSVFDTVEGNSTFYGLPAAATVERWAAETPPHFRFCFKFPQAITHRMMLRYCEPETSEFLFCLAPLLGRLGPLLLQLPPNFGASDLTVLVAYLDALPREFACAVEVRHPEFFDGGVFEEALDAALDERGVARVAFDARAMFAAADADAATREARRRKPRLPLRTTVTGGVPFVRFIGTNDPEDSRSALQAWAVQLATWVSRGVRPYFFTHAPDDAHAPALARLVYELVREQRVQLGQLPPFPGEREPPSTEPREPPAQRDLFA